MSKFPVLHFPPVQLQFVPGHDPDELYFFDIFRRRKILLTPEEWVRQHLAHYLMNQVHYPRTHIKLESGLQVNRLGKRSDLVVTNRQGQPYLLAECKAPTEIISDETLKQAGNYNNYYKAPFLLVTNGLVSRCFHIDFAARQFTALKALPPYPV